MLYINCWKLENKHFYFYSLCESNGIPEATTVPCFQVDLWLRIFCRLMWCFYFGIFRFNLIERIWWQNQSYYFKKSKHQKDRRQTSLCPEYELETDTPWEQSKISFRSWIVRFRISRKFERKNFSGSTFLVKGKNPQTYTVIIFYVHELLC